MPSPKTPEEKKMPTSEQRLWLEKGLGQAGGKLPLFTTEGQPYPPDIIYGCLEKGWAEKWFKNPIKPEWLVCKLSKVGRELLTANDNG